MIARSRSKFRCSPRLSILFSLLLLGAWPDAVGAQEQVNVDSRVTLTFSGYVLNRATNTFDTLGTIRNISTDRLATPMALVITGITPSSVTLANATGQTSDGKPFVAVSVPAGGLAPGSSVTSVTLRFNNPNRVPFSFSRSVRAVVVGQDTTPPVVAITRPSPNATFNIAGSVTVGGTVDDPAATVQVSNGGTSVVAIVQADGSFSVLIPLIEGRNTLAVRATDRAGNIGTASVVVTLDTSPPALTISSPAQDTLLGPGSSSVTVEGTVDDPTSRIEIANGPVSVPATVGAGGRFQAQVPLIEGRNVLVARATDSAGNFTVASVTVVLDTTPPNVQIESPVDGFQTSAATISVAGSVFDTVSRTDNQVTVNSRAATVVDRGFAIADIPLVFGPNTIRAQAVDRAGNRSSMQITVIRQQQPGPQLSISGGNNQTGQVNSALPQPLEVLLTDGQGNPLADQPVVFNVVRGDGTVSASPDNVQVLELMTDPNGVARVNFTLGSRTGAAVHRVQVSSPVSADLLEFSASATVKPPSQVFVVSGDTQRGLAARPLADPFIVVVRDEAGNTVAGVPLTFQVVEGGGSFNGNASAVVTSDASGRASARLTLGSEEGVNNNVATVRFENQTSAPATFRASGKLPGQEQTSISGVVLDNAHQAVPGVTLTVIGTSAQTQSDQQGKFLLGGVPPGPVHFLVNGGTATRPGTWASLMYELNIVQGQDNPFTGPIYILPLDFGNARTVRGKKLNESVVLHMAGVPELAFTVAANSVTCPGDADECTISITQVKQDKIPMPVPGGTVFPLAWTTQPPGVHFDPPMAVTLPNNTGLGPGASVEIFSFDHDVGEFIPVAEGTVNADGSLVVSNPGQGITKGGWGGAAPPPPPKTCTGKAPACQKCDTNTGLFVADASKDGKGCDDKDGSYTINGVTVGIEASCQGVCDSGTCKPNANKYSISAARAAVDAAVGKVFDTCVGAGLKKTMQDNMKNNKIAVSCLAAGGNCAHADSIGGNSVTLEPAAMNPALCGPLSSSVLHELVHAHGNDPGDPDTATHNTYDGTVPSANDKAYGCEKACFNVGRGTAAACK